jgi:lysozyme
MKWIAKQLARVSEDVVLIGVRGMYATKNKRGVYDDALIWCQKSTGLIATYTGNVDPSAYRKGVGKGSKKGMASLKDGIWSYKAGPHPLVGGYPAFRQASDVVVSRDGDPNYDDKGQFGINIHRGGKTGTSSLGCQTVKPTEWIDFQQLGYSLLAKSKQKTFPYILISKEDIG